MATIAHKASILYYLFYHWVRYIFDKLYQGRVYRLQTGNIPKEGTPTILVSNHQNSLLDAFHMLFGTQNSFLHFISRADVFKNKHIAKLLYGLGLIPIYRVRDGVGKIKDNLQMFDEVERYLHEGGMLAIYPEATHMDGNYLGRFYLSYTRIAFETAALSDFKQEVFILPATLYYEDFTAFRADSLITYAEPFSLKPYYELYQQEPRLAEEQVNEIIRHKVQSNMLDIRDREHYDQVMGFISYTENAYAEREKDIDMAQLPQALKVRKAIEAKLYAQKESHPEKLEEIYARTAEFHRLLDKYRINAEALAKPATTLESLRSLFFYLLFSPLYLLGMLPHILLFCITPLVMRKIDDKLMEASIAICIWIIGIPLFYLVYFLLTGILMNWFTALVIILLLPSLGKFAWWFHKHFQQDFQCFRARLVRERRPKTWAKMERLHKELRQDLETIC